MRAPPFRWEQDGHGGEHGMATFFPDTPYQITLRIDSFHEASQLYQSIDRVVANAREDARRVLQAKIARIQP